MPELAPITIGLLGPTSLSVAGEPVEITTPRLRELLARLALDAGRVLPVDRLIDDIWGGDPPASAVGSLRSYIANLRRVFDRAGADGAEVLVTSGRGYSLEVPDQAVDAARLDTLVAEGRDAANRDRHDDALLAYDAALGLWRGEALADVRDRPFARPEVTRLEELRRTVREERLQVLLDAGRASEALPELEGLVHEDPTRERPHVQLMLALHRVGRTADALALHRTYRATLADEFGLDPGPELGSLAERILRQDPGLLVGVERLGTRSPRSGPTAVSGIVGREPERSLVASALDAMERGHGSLLVIGGEPGIGKSALCDDLVASAEARGFAVYRGTCSGSGAPTLWPWREVVRQILASRNDPALTDGDVAPARDLLTPTLEQAPAITTAVDVEETRFALVRAVSTLVGRAAPVVVIVEDIHWADPTSLDVLHALGTTSRAAGVLLVVTHRDNAPDQTDALRTAIADLVRLPGAAVIQLRGLELEAIEALVERTTGAGDTELAADLHERTAGNPFFVRQLLPLAREGAQEVPAGLKHVIERRATQLGETVRRTLDAAAVLGLEASLPVLAGMLDLPVREIADHVDRATAHGLLESLSGGDLETRFSHALVRDTLYELLGTARRMELHASAARVLATLRRAPDEVIAEHHWSAAPITDPRRAAESMQRAAAAARRLGALDRAELDLRRALAVLDLHPGTPPRTELAIRLQLVHILTSQHGWSAEEVGIIAGRVREIADEAGIGPDLVALWWALWNHHVIRGELTDAGVLAVQLQRDAESHDSPPCRVAGHVARAVMLTHADGDVDGAVAELAAARRAEHASPPDRLGAAPEHLSVALRVAEAVAHGVAGNQEAAREASEDALRAAQTVDDPYARATALVNAAWVATFDEDAERTHHHAAEALRIDDRRRFTALSDVATVLHAWATARLGRPSDLELADAAIGRLRDRGQRHRLAALHVLLADTAAAEGHDEAASRHLAAAQSLGVASDDPFDRWFLDRWSDRGSA